MKQAVILAGGKGTRLSSRLNGLPKPMIDLCGIPLIERQILLLKRYNFTDVIILVNYASDKIIEFCEENNNWGLNVTCIDDGEPKGTAGAILNIFEFLNDYFLVIYGDTMLEVDLDNFLDFHLHGDIPSATIFLHPNDHPFDSDLVEVDLNNKVLAFNPYPHGNDYHSNLVNAALYWVNKESLKFWIGIDRVFDFGKDLFPTMLSNGHLIKGYNSFEYVKDCGTPERIDKVVNDFKSGKIQRAQLSHKQKAIFLDRDGTLNKEVNHLVNIEDFDLLPNVPEAIKIFNKNEFRVCVITNQPVIARGELDINGLIQIHKKFETEIGKAGAFIDKIYFCPHHPDTGFKNEVKELKIECNCRKPNIGMIETGISDLNIDLNYSWLIGDTTTDIQTAKNAGVKSILVKTGYSGLDGKFKILPDFEVPDLYSASIFITEIYPTLVKLINKSISLLEGKKFILVSGLSRSGKSTFSKILEFELKNKGKSVHNISLDRWIRSENERGSTVLGRYDIDGIIEFINEIETNNSSKFSLSLPFYDKKNKKSLPNFESININKDDVFILDGTIVFLLDKKLRCNFFNYLIKIDEEIRKKRVIDEYLSRGLNSIESNEIYLSRQLDETPILNSINNQVDVECIDLTYLFKN